MKRIHPKDRLCKLCKFKTTKVSINSHFKHHHPGKSVRNNVVVLGKGKTTKKYSKHKNQSSPIVEYVQFPILIRVPVIIGQAQIVNQFENTEK